ncbi:MAG: hypothetical protein HYY00_04735 [Chloroflexi bacterium]|nr:hypothetical protein [Chloroflexota bacterium]
MATAVATKPSIRGALGWAMYDFANSIWPMNVTTLYFALWVTDDHGAKDIVYSFALSGSMLGVALLSPMLGAGVPSHGGPLPAVLPTVLRAGEGLAPRVPWR